MLNLGLSEILSIISIIVTLLGVVVALYVIPRKKLYYSLYSATLVEVKSEDIQGHTVVIDGKPAKSLIKTTVVFRNSGNREITSSDFSDTMPLRITAAERIFHPKESYQVKAKDPKSIKIKIVDEKTIEINFTYIKAKRSFSFEVLHDGKLSVSGEPKTGELRDGLGLDTLFNKIGLIFYAALLFFSLVFTELLLACAYSLSDSADIKAITTMVAGFTLVIFLIIILLAMLLRDVGIITVKNPFRKKKDPRKNESKNQNDPPK